MRQVCERDARVHEHEDREQRHVADELHVPLGGRAQDEVLRQPGDADERPEQRGEQDAGHDEPDRVGDAFLQCVPHGLGGPEVAVADWEPRLSIEEPVVQVPAIVGQVLPQPQEEGDERCDDGRLETPREIANVAPRRWSARISGHECVLLPVQRVGAGEGRTPSPAPGGHVPISGTAARTGGRHRSTARSRRARGRSSG